MYGVFTSDFSLIRCIHSIVAMQTFKTYSEEPPGSTTNEKPALVLNAVVINDHVTIFVYSQISRMHLEAFWAGNVARKFLSVLDLVHDVKILGTGNMLPKIGYNTLQIMLRDVKILGAGNMSPKIGYIQIYIMMSKYGAPGICFPI